MSCGARLTHHQCFYQGSDPAQLRLQQAVTKDQGNVYIEEITCDAPDTNVGTHMAEVVSYLAIQHDGDHRRGECCHCTPP